jgi:hypothetical protein
MAWEAMKRFREGVMAPEGFSLLGERLRLIRVELSGQDSVDVLTGVLGARAGGLETIRAAR